jgi:hypothetical protein
MERKSPKSILKRSTKRKDKAMKTPTETKAPKTEVKDAPKHYDPIQERAPDRDVTKADVKRDTTSARDDIIKQIADHEKWMSDHSDDARGVQERLQEVAVLQQKLVEFNAPKHETRVRQTQTV